MSEHKRSSNPNASRFQAALVAVAVLIAATGLFVGAWAALIAAVAVLILMALLSNWMIGQVERLTGERFALERDGTTIQVSSGYAGADVKELNEEYGRMGVRMRRNLKLRDDESQILELISADADRFIVLEAITVMLSNQFPGNRFRFATNDMGRLDSAERFWHVTESTEYDFGWVLEATLDGVQDPDPGVINLACDLARLTLLKARDQRSLKYQADHDVLTGLLSRRAILAALDEAIDSGEPLGLIYGDVDHFKQINDTLGHLAGDDMLVEVSSRIRQQAKQSGLDVAPGRLGGDEYLCVLTNCTEMDMRKYVEAVGFAMNVPFELSTATTSASMSWGAAWHSGGTDCDSSELLKEADVALYQVKRDGRNSFRIFDEELREWTEEQKRLEADLAMSISKRSGVHAEFQPQFDANRRLVGFEALGRWYRLGVGPVAPDDFLPIAVERGLMADFDREMYRHVAQVLGGLRKAGQPFGTVSVNVSAEWLEEPEFVRTTLAALRAASVDPRSVVLEITESSLLRDLAERGHRLEELRRWGIRIAIDDFGTGYSSLSYLRELPIDIVKLDKEFVSDVDTSTESRLIVQAILNLATALRLEVIAEGVERESQFSTLVQLGCNAFQGYLLGRPASLEEAKAMAMRQWPANPFASDYDWTTTEPSPIENIVHADFRRRTG